MDTETAIRAFARAGNNLPCDSMRWALHNWDEAAPGLLDVLERFADGEDRSEDAAGAVFFILHLAAEKREARAFAPLCRLARDAEATEAALVNTLSPDDQVLMYETGHFATLWKAMVTRLGLEAEFTQGDCRRFIRPAMRGVPSWPRAVLTRPDTFEQTDQ